MRERVDTISSVKSAFTRLNEAKSSGDPNEDSMSVSMSRSRLNSELIDASETPSLGVKIEAPKPLKPSLGSAVLLAQLLRNPQLA